MTIVSRLKEFAKMKNLVTEAGLKKEKLDLISLKVVQGFKDDENSCREWLADIKKVEELASLAAKKKNYPLPNSANIKFPLITKASYEFSSRTYPEILKDDKVVKARVIGLDLDNTKAEKAERVADYLNYQLLFESDEWERDLDTLLTRLSLIGFICKKQYYDPVRKKIKTEICDPHKLIINSNAKSLSDAARISHIICVRVNDLIEHSRAKIYSTTIVNELIDELGTNELDVAVELVEQHTFLDLDDDNYSEPYIVTYDRKSGKLLRIAPRFLSENVIGAGNELKYIDPIQIFTDFHFLKNPKGDFQSVGFGILMLHLNETINSILNMLVDAGQLANQQNGYKDSRLKNMGSGDSLHNPGELKTVKCTAGMTLKEGIFPFNWKEPSSVLFQLLGLLIQTGKDLSSSTEVNTGGTSADNAKTGAVMALQREGLKVFTSIQKRLYRSQTVEFRNLFQLNSIYLDPNQYYNVLSDKKAVAKDDFDGKSIDVIPTADPNLSSEMQRASKNQIIALAQSMPGTNKVACTRLILENSLLSNQVDQIMLSPEEMNQPDPALIEVQAKIQNMSEQNQLKGHELQIREMEVKIEATKAMCQCMELKAKAILEIAQAQAQQDNGKFKEYEMQLKSLETLMDATHKMAEFKQTNIQHENDMKMQQQEVNNNVGPETTPDGGVAE